MKLYDFALAPSSQRVRVYLAEKGLEVPTEQVNVREGALFAEPFTSMNPFHCVPFMTLDDGPAIAESMSTCSYLEELHPEPPLFGRTPAERAVVDMWLRRFELDAFIPLLHALRNHLPNFAGRVVPGTRSDLPQSEAMVSRGKEMAGVLFDRAEPHMAQNEFVAGPDFTVADITAFFTLRMAYALEMDIGASWPATHAWFQKVSARPAFQL